MTVNLRCDDTFVQDENGIGYRIAMKIFCEDMKIFGSYF